MMLPKLWYCSWTRLPERAVLFDEAAALDGVADDDEHFVVLEGLGDVVEGAALHRGDRALDRRECRDHQHRHLVVDLLQLVERRDPVHAGEHHVHDGRVERHRAGELQPFLGGAREAHAIPLARQQRLEDLAHDLLVVDDEDGSVMRCASHDVVPARTARTRPAPSRPETDCRPSARPA